MAIQCSVAIATYLDHLRIERGLSQNSVESYRRDLGKFESLLLDKSLTFDALSESDISSLIGALTSGGLAPSSINRFLSSLKGFYKYCALEYSIASPMADINQANGTGPAVVSLTLTDSNTCTLTKGAAGVGTWIVVLSR